MSSRITLRESVGLMDGTTVRDRSAASTHAAMPATRRDDGGSVEEVSFIGPSGAGMFAFLHLPEDRPILGGLLVCSPMDAETLRHYRKEVLLGRALAPRGVAVLRFHYRGAGNSDCEAEDVTYDSMREDALTAAAWLAERIGTSDLAFLGTRWGALTAAAAASERPGAPIVLWEPTLDTATYFRESLRWRRIRDLHRGTETSTEAMLETMRTAGQIDVLGHPLGHALYQSSAGRTLRDELGDDPRPALLVQIGLGGELRTDYAKLCAAWRDAGFDVESVRIADEVAWRVQVDTWRPEDLRPETGELLETTSEWLLRRLAGGRSAA